jgi:hypothetical protein
MSETIKKEERVRLIASDKKYQTAPVFIAPIYTESTMSFDVNGKVYKGKKVSEGDEAVVVADGTPIRMSDVDSYKFSHLQEFVSGSPVDDFFVELLRGSGMVAKNKQSVNPDYHRFYFENHEDEAIATISKAELTFDALSRVKGLSIEEMEDYCRLLGENVLRLTKKQIEAKLMNVAYNKPKDLLDLFDDKNRKQKMFLRKLIEKGIVRITNGKYTYGTDLIGANEDFAIQYLKDPNNNSMVSQWNQMIKRGSNSEVEATETTTPVVKSETTNKKGDK